MFFVNYLLSQVLMKFLCKFPEDDDDAETCRKDGKFLEQLNEKISHPRSCNYFYLLCHIR